MKVKTQMVKVYLPPEDLEAVRARAEEIGLTVSELLRNAALRPPRRLPARRRIVGLEAMDAAGATLGQAIRDEAGRTPAEAPLLARRLHESIMALTVETMPVAPPPAPSGRIGNGATRTKKSLEEHARLVRFRATPEEEDVMRRFAAVYGLALSEYVRRRVLGRPMQPAWPSLEGLPAVQRCVALLGHAAWNGMAGAGAEQLYEDALQKCKQLRRQGRTAA